jgi:hypothetical protein
MIIENLRMRMIDEEAPVQFIDAHRPFKLKKKHILDVRGVYDSNIILTEWNADMVVKIYAPAAGLDGQEVYAQHRDFTFVGKFKVENQRMYMIEDKAQIQLVKGGTSFVLSRDEVVKIIGVFSLANFFTDWKADTVIKVFARNHELDGEDVYAKFSDYRIVCNDSSKDNSNNQDN